MKVLIFAFLIVLVVSASEAVLAKKAVRTGHAHTHGEAKADFGIEGANASVGFEIDTQSLLGFERDPKTAEEKKTVAKVLETFRSKISDIFEFEGRLGCIFERKKLLIGPDPDGEAGHQSLIGDFNVTCRSKILPSRVKVNFRKFFANIQSIKIQVVTETGAKSSEIPGVGELSVE